MKFKMFHEVNAILFFSFILSSNSIEVTIEQGTLQGLEQQSRSGNEYYEFDGIPLAKPPVGNLRFQPPQPPESWHGVRNASVDAPACIQKSSLGDVWGQEDCLFLNVHVPKNRKGLFPVMVFIHGGGFSAGRVIPYKPSYFMDHDVIVVTIQYRLGILGFLSTGDEVVPGNNGMKDQVMALTWVQKNIAAFGGNPKEVTIFGESAGAASVHYHMYSPLSKGLFHRAISQSGNSLSHWAHVNLRIARKRAQALGIISWCPTENTNELMSCLKEVPGEELVRANDRFFIWDTYPAIPFSVVSEPSTVKDAFITENPLYQDITSNVPWIVGINSGEGAIPVVGYLVKNGTKLKYLNEHYRRLLPVVFSYGSYPANNGQIDKITQSIKKFYLRDKPIDVETAKDIVRLYTDGYFAHSALEAARRHNAHNGTVYFYYYDHRNKNSLSSFLSEFPSDLGVGHADELISLFHLNNVFPKLTNNDGDDYKVSERMVKYWVNFATNGNPNDGGAVWTPVQSDAVEYFHITTKRDGMKKDLLKDEYLFWKNLQIIPPREENRIFRST